MSSNGAHLYKEHPIMRVSKLTAASASPASCSSIGALSYGASLSSSCLTCTETDVWDVDIPDDLAFGHEAQELSRNCSGSSRFDSGPLEKQLVSGKLCQLIRDDLEKQRYTRVNMASTPSPPARAAAGAEPRPWTAAPMRRLPAQHRALLVGWMRQVTHALRLQLPTLFTATSILDRFLTASETLPPDGFLQLLALTSMSIAVKYNEVYQVAPDVWLGLAVNPAGQRLYLPRDLQRYEFTVLQAIGWRLHEPTTFTFLEHFLMCQPYGCGHMEDTALQNSHETEPRSPAQAVSGPVCTGPIGSRAAMLAEVTLMYDTFLFYDASAVALACVVLAEHMVFGTAAPYMSEQQQKQQQQPPQSPKSLGLQQQQPTAAVAVAAVSGLKLELVAPALEYCVNDLAKCYAAAMQPADGTQVVAIEA